MVSANDELESVHTVEKTNLLLLEPFDSAQDTENIYNTIQYNTLFLTL